MTGTWDELSEEGLIWWLHSDIALMATTCSLRLLLDNVFVSNNFYEVLITV